MKLTLADGSKKLTKAEAVKFHQWLGKQSTIHKWECLELLDLIIGYCPTSEAERKGTKE